ncbi:MAG: hypothetical protein OEM27_02050 [Nitrospinota bacterium]|nr:hypothetical protein [Nitrospinota bacterium]
MSKRATMNKSQNQNKLKKVSQIIGSLALAMGLCLMTALPAVATEKIQYEDVYINGYKLGFFEQMALEDHINRDIPDGDYWFELDTGMWGPVGGTAIGRIVVPEDYQDYVESKLSNQIPATEVELSASAEECDHRCMYW